MMRKTLQAALCLCLSPLLAAQQAATLDAPTPQTVAPRALPASVTVRKNTRIRLVALEAVSSATAVNGQLVPLAVEEDVLVDGLVAIPKGTLATGKVTHLQKGVAGKHDGYLRVEPISLALANGKRVKLWESAYGEDDCANAGPCWALWIVSAPLLPAILIAKVVDAQEDIRDKPAGKDQTIQARDTVDSYAARRIVLPAGDLHPPQPASGSLPSIDGLADKNQIAQQ